MHTGMRKMFDATRAGVAKVIEPSTLRWIGYSHFEPDECGALNEWLRVAPQAQALTSQVGVAVMLDDYRRPSGAAARRRRGRPARPPSSPVHRDAAAAARLGRGPVLRRDRGDALLLRSLLPARRSVTADGRRHRRAAAEAIRGNLQGPLANDMPYTPYTDATFDRIAELAPKTLAAMHGSSWRGDGRRAVTGLKAVVRELLGGAA
jgi:hypothetical protein